MSDASNSKRIINGQGPDDQALATMIFRPALRSMWFLFLGFFLGPAIMFFERDPDGHPAKWIALSFVCLGVIVHRLSLKYILGAGLLKSSSWWGLKPDEVLTLACVSEVRVLDGYVGRLAGCGHIEIRSEAPDETDIMMLGQPEAWKVADAIKAAINKARS